MRRAIFTLAAVGLLLSFAAPASAQVVMDDFTAITAANHPPGGVGTAGTWYDLTHNTFGTPSVVTGTLRVDDGGFTNGIYAEMDETIPATGEYRVEIDLIELFDDPANSNGIRDLQIGVWINASHRPENPGNFVDVAAGGNGAPDAVGTTSLVLDTGDNSVTGTPVETIVTTQFSAVAGDSIFIAIGTDVQGTDANGTGGGAGNSGTWGNSFYRMDDLTLVPVQVATVSQDIADAADFSSIQSAVTALSPAGSLDDGITDNNVVRILDAALYDEPIVIVSTGMVIEDGDPGDPRPRITATATAAGSYVIDVDSDDPVVLRDLIVLPHATDPTLRAIVYDEATDSTAGVGYNAILENVLVAGNDGADQPVSTDGLTPPTVTPVTFGDDAVDFFSTSAPGGSNVTLTNVVVTACTGAGSGDAIRFFTDGGTINVNEGVVASFNDRFGFQTSGVNGTTINWNGTQANPIIVHGNGAEGFGLFDSTDASLANFNWVAVTGNSATFSGGSGAIRDSYAGAQTVNWTNVTIAGNDVSNGTPTDQDHVVDVDYQSLLATNVIIGGDGSQEDSTRNVNSNFAGGPTAVTGDGLLLDRSGGPTSLNTAWSGDTDGDSWENGTVTGTGAGLTFVGPNLLSLDPTDPNYIVVGSFALAEAGPGGNPLIGAGTFGPVPQPGDIVINEFVFDDSSTDDFQFIELHNPQSSAIDISNWTIELADTAPDATITIPAATTIAAGGFFVAGDAGVTPDLDTTGINPQNGSDAITLKDSVGTIMDSVVYERNKADVIFEAGVGEPPFDGVATDSGGGFWPNHTMIEAGSINTGGDPSFASYSISRRTDGEDTDDNDADFVFRVATPGASNTSNATVGTLPYTNDFDALADGDSIFDLGGSFVSFSAQDPSVADTPGTGSVNPSVIPASPQGGNVGVFWDSAGGGNAGQLNLGPFTADLQFDGYVYIETTLLPATESETWSITLGRGDGTFHNTPILAGGAYGGRGVEALYERTDTSVTLSLVEFQNGAGTVLGTPIDLTALGTGWQRVLIQKDAAGNAELVVGGVVGDATRTTTSTSGTASFSESVTLSYGYREAVAGTTGARPLTVDGIVVGPPDTLTGPGTSVEDWMSYE